MTIRRLIWPIALLICTLIWASLSGANEDTASAQDGRTASYPSSDGPSPSEESSMLFGTLLSDPLRAPLEARAGVQIVELELGWDAYEPREGAFDLTYAFRARQKLQAFQAAGMKVVLGAGLQYPPGWAFRYAGSRYVNQYGAASPNLNLTFNQDLRRLAERYLARIDQDLGLHSFWAVRVGSGSLIETLYPDAWDGRRSNSFWAFDQAAQGGAGRPASIPPPPYIGWRPGQSSFEGASFSSAQTERWYGWYLDALVDGVTWQISTYRRLAFSGFVQVLMPGQGTRPGQFSLAIANRLDGSGDPYGTLSRGAVWDRVIERLAGWPGVVAYVSSVADGSGNDDRCQSGDAAVSPASDDIGSWSATRWISYSAARRGLPRMGENPGRADSPRYNRSMLTTAAEQARSCGFIGLMWAHSADLHTGANGVTLSAYGQVIDRYRR